MTHCASKSKKIESVRHKEPFPSIESFRLLGPTWSDMINMASISWYSSAVRNLWQCSCYFISYFLLILFNRSLHIYVSSVCMPKNIKNVTHSATSDNPFPEKKFLSKCGRYIQKISFLVFYFYFLMQILHYSKWTQFCWRSKMTQTGELF